MKEDIKILEDLAETLNKTCENGICEASMSIENLIKGYKELEKENKQLKEYIVVAPNLDEMTAVKYSHIQKEAYFKGRAEEQQKAEQIIYEYYIPKSKMQREMEKLDNMMKETINGKLQKYTPGEIIFLKRFLQELMEDK